MQPACAGSNQVHRSAEAENDSDHSEGGGNTNDNVEGVFGSSIAVDPVPINGMNLNSLKSVVCEVVAHPVGVQSRLEVKCSGRDVNNQDFTSVTPNNKANWTIASAATGRVLADKVDGGASFTISDILAEVGKNDFKATLDLVEELTSAGKTLNTSAIGPEFSWLFITDASFNGDLGRLSGANAKCSLAASGGTLTSQLSIPGLSWQAILWDDGRAASSFFLNRGIFNINGEVNLHPSQSFFTKDSAILQNEVYRRITNENGFIPTAVANQRFWSGAHLMFGTASPKVQQTGQTCSNWTNNGTFSATGNTMSAFGSSGSLDFVAMQQFMPEASFWNASMNGYTICNSTRSLLCVAWPLP